MNNKDDIVERLEKIIKDIQPIAGRFEEINADLQYIAAALSRIQLDAARIAELEDENADLRQSLEIVAADRDAKVGDVLQRNKRIAELEAEVERRDRLVAKAARLWDDVSHRPMEIDFILEMEEIGFMHEVKVTKKNHYDYEEWEVGDTVYEWTRKAYAALEEPTP